MALICQASLIRTVSRSKTEENCADQVRKSRAGRNRGRAHDSAGRHLQQVDRERTCHLALAGLSRAFRPKTL
jgi:hypothetical protein